VQVNFGAEAGARSDAGYISLRIQQFRSALLQQVPRFSISFVAIAGPLRWPYDRVQHGHALSSLAQQEHGWDQIPRVFGNDVGCEEIDFVQRVIVLLQVVWHELTAVSCARSCGCGFDLHSQEVALIFNAHVVRQRVSPRLADTKTVLRRLRHKLQLHPLATLFEILERLPMLHTAPFLPRKHERRDHRPRP